MRRVHVVWFALQGLDEKQVVEVMEVVMCCACQKVPRDYLAPGTSRFAAVSESGLCESCEAPRIAAADAADELRRAVPELLEALQPLTLGTRFVLSSTGLRITREEEERLIKAVEKFYTFQPKGSTE